MNLNIIKKKCVDGISREEAFQNTFYQSFLEVECQEEEVFEMKKWEIIRNQGQRDTLLYCIKNGLLNILYDYAKEEKMLYQNQGGKLVDIVAVGGFVVCMFEYHFLIIDEKRKSNVFQSDLNVYLYQVFVDQGILNVIVSQSSGINHIQFEQKLKIVKNFDQNINLIKYYNNNYYYTQYYDNNQLYCNNQLVHKSEQQIVDFDINDNYIFLLKNDHLQIIDFKYQNVYDFCIQKRHDYINIIGNYVNLINKQENSNLLIKVDVNNQQFILLKEIIGKINININKEQLDFHQYSKFNYQYSGNLNITIYSQNRNLSKIVIKDINKFKMIDKQLLLPIDNSIQYPFVEYILKKPFGFTIYLQGNSIAQQNTFQIPILKLDYNKYKHNQQQTIFISIPREKEENLQNTEITLQKVIDNSNKQIMVFQIDNKEQEIKKLFFVIKDSNQNFFCILNSLNYTIEYLEKHQVILIGMNQKLVFTQSLKKGVQNFNFDTQITKIKTIDDYVYISDDRNSTHMYKYNKNKNTIEYVYGSGSGKEVHDFKIYKDFIIQWNFNQIQVFCTKKINFLQYDKNRKQYINQYSPLFITPNTFKDIYDIKQQEKINQIVVLNEYQQNYLKSLFNQQKDSIDLLVLTYNNQIFYYSLLLEPIKLSDSQILQISDTQILRINQKFINLIIRSI